jgi:Acetokinase family
MKILVLNSGSSSQKACLYEIGGTLPDHPPACLWEGRIEWGGDSAAITVKNSEAVVQKEQLTVTSREQTIRHLLLTLVTGMCTVCERRSVAWPLFWAEWTFWYSPPEWARTPLRYEPRRAVDWNFSVSDSVTGQTRDPLLIRTSLLRTRECVF